jgi:hypothetical protein
MLRPLSLSPPPSKIVPVRPPAALLRPPCLLEYIFPKKLVVG